MTIRSLGSAAALVCGLACASPALAADPEKVTLAQALERGWRANPTIEQARASFERAEALVTQSRATWLPTLTVSGTLTQLEGDRAINGRTINAATTANATLLLQVPIIAAPRWLATGQASDAREAARVDVESLRRNVASLVGRAWLQVRLQQRIVEVAERALKVSSEELELSRARGEGGLGTRLETARAEREQADNTSRLALTRADLAVSRDALGALIGEHGPIDITGDPQLPPIPESPDLSARPDLRAAQLRVELAQRRVDESWTDYVPSLNAALGPTATTPSFDPVPAVGFQAQLLLSAPLFDGLARSGLNRERRATLRDATAARDQLLFQAEAQLRSALTQLTQRREAQISALRSAALAAEAYKLARLANAEGLSTNLDVIEAERGARDAETNASVVQNGAETAQLDVLVAIGVVTPEASP